MPNDNEIKRLFSQLQNIQIATSGGGKPNEKIWFKLPSGRVQGICVQAIAPGSCLALLADDGQWYLVRTTEVAPEERSTRQISYRKTTPTNPKLKYPVITFILADLQFNQQSSPEGNTYEHWLTGGNPKLKYLKNFSFKDNISPIPDKTGGILSNHGKNENIAIKAKFNEVSLFNNQSSRPYRRLKIITSFGEFDLDLYFFNRQQPLNTNLFYLGNGIYQSMPEDGIGEIINSVPVGVEIPGATMKTRPAQPGEPETSPGSGITYDGISSLDVPATNRIRLDANILPDNSNTAIHDDVVETLPGSVILNSVDLNNFYYPTETNAVGRSFIGKTVEHTAWMPAGNTNFNYSGTKSGGGNSYTYTETMSGELLGIAWENRYVTQQFTINKTTQTVPVLNESQEIASIGLQESLTKNEVLTLKSFNGLDADLLLNNEKFLVINNTPRDVVTLNSIQITLETLEFAIRVIDNDVDYNNINPDFDLTVYENEEVITSYVIDDMPYLITGVISSTSYENRAAIFIINIAKKEKLPKIKVKNKSASPYPLALSLPFVGELILNNGSFWNYYLSFNIFNRQIENYYCPSFSFYKNFSYTSDEISGAGEGSFRFQLLCDQTIRFIHLNPISRPFCNFNGYKNHYPPSQLLLVDNLAGDCIYRVNETVYLQVDLVLDFNFIYNIKKIPISKWQIYPNGDIKYTETFLVDYKLDLPYYDKVTNELNAFGNIQLSHSYHPA